MLRCTVSVAELMAHNKQTRTEIDVLRDLIRDKCMEISRIEDYRGHSPRCRHHQADSPPAPAPSPPSYLRKLKRVHQTMKDLEELTNADGLNEEAIDVYLTHVQDTYPRVLILTPGSTLLLKSAPKETVKRFLAEWKRIAEYEHVFLVLKQEEDAATESRRRPPQPRLHYSLLYFNAKEAIAYHYDVAAKLHAKLAERIVLRVRRCLKVEQLIDVERKNVYAESVLFAVDNMMRIVTNVVSREMAVEAKEQEEQDMVWPLQLVWWPSSSSSSQPDYWKIIIMSRYIVRKLGEMEALAMECSGSSVKN